MANPILVESEEQVENNDDAAMVNISTPQDLIEKPLLKPIITLRDRIDYENGEFDTSLDDDFLMDRFNSFTVYTQEDLLNYQYYNVAEVSDDLHIPRVFASRLLRRYNWNSDKLYAAWRADEDGARESVGLSEKPSPEITGKLFGCQICFQVFPRDRMEILNCGHLYCLDCWRIYISTAINNDAAQCLMLTCPQPSCNTAVLDDVITNFAAENDKKKFQKYLVRSYVEYDSKLKWCPAPDCDYALQCWNAGNRASGYEVVCQCLHRFCWICLEESHYPVACDTAAKWISENETENQQIKYSQYLTRWTNNDSARENAIENLRKAEQIEGIDEVMTGSWELIIECRRILKWSYAFGYYLDEAENGSFDNLQAQAEDGLERLHRYAEEQTEQFSLKEFAEFRVDLLGYINVTKQLFNNLVIAQRDLQDAA